MSSINKGLANLAAKIFLSLLEKEEKELPKDSGKLLILKHAREWINNGMKRSHDDKLVRDYLKSLVKKYIDDV